MEKKWRRFEKLVANIQKQLAPDATVQHDDKIWGHDSKKNRQVDVSIRERVGQFELLIVMSCKDWNVPVDVDEIDSFSNVIKDVHANKGAMVAANGFTDGAKNMALAKGIDLYRLIDAEAHEWQTYVTIPVLCDFRGLDQFRFSLPSYLSISDPRELVIYNAEGDMLGTTSVVLHKRWNADELPNEPGEHGWFPLKNETIKIKYNGEFHEVNIGVRIIVKQSLYFGQLQLVDIKGFRDEQSGAIATNGFTTEYLDVMRVEREWSKIDDTSELAVTPIFTLTALDRYKLPS